MIALDKLHEAQRLLALGTLSQRKVSAIVGISRATVSSIAKGTYRPRQTQRREDDEPYPPVGPVSRCPSCGRLVQIPCLACRVERIQDQERRMLQEARRKVRQQALRRFLHAVREANWQRDAREATRVA